MNKVIIYGSIYGSSKTYALKLSEITGIPVYDYQDIKDIGNYDLIIYIGSLYAGGVLGLTKTLRKATYDQRHIIITVGIADPFIKENRDNIISSLKGQLPNDIYTKAIFYHLRGALNYSKLKFHHKTMMKLLYKVTIKKDKNTLTAEDKAFIETYEKDVDFIDLMRLDEIAKKL